MGIWIACGEALPLQHVYKGSIVSFAMRVRVERCSSCGAALREGAPAAMGMGWKYDLEDTQLCEACQLLRALQRDLAPVDECPRCRATQILRTPGRAREEILVCPNCDHIWARIRP